MTMTASRPGPSRAAPRRAQSGAFLLEALIGVLVFAFGILGLVGLQAVAIRNTNDLQYRGEAIQIANAAIGRMWTMERAKLEVMYEGDAGTGGDGYTALNEAANRLPGVYGNSALAPTVVVEDGPSTTSSLVTVTIRWQLPGEATPHQYVGAVMVGLN
jgi:type IV pilus assembly protein PilV